MSLTSIRPYFIARCQAVGLVKHPEAFDIENVPSTVIDRSFQVTFSSGTGAKLNQSDRELDASVSVVFFIKSYKNTEAGFDSAVEKAQALIVEVEKPANRLGGLLKNVLLETFSIEPLVVTNDNVVKVTLVFTVKTILAL